MSKRIDLNQFGGKSDRKHCNFTHLEEEYIKGQDNLLEDCQTLKDRMQIILAELKKMYAREDELLDALRIIRDDLQEAMAYGAYTLAQSEKLQKIRNFANDASQ